MCTCNQKTPPQPTIDTLYNHQTLLHIPQMRDTHTHTHTYHSGALWQAGLSGDARPGRNTHRTASEMDKRTLINNQWTKLTSIVLVLQHA
ncbi:UNVERIFIED_CONTAM: hypothetical protein FKN15_066321 [Acipenser sinensis]